MADKALNMNAKYPKRIADTMFGFHVFTAAYLGYGAKMVLTGRSALSIIMWFSFCIVPELMCLRFKRRVDRRGFAIWRFKVLASTYEVYKNKKYDCILAVPDDDSYTGKMIEIYLRKGDKLPENGSIIDICTPGDIKIYEIDNRYVMSFYYEMKTIPLEQS